MLLIAIIISDELRRWVVEWVQLPLGVGRVGPVPHAAIDIYLRFLYLQMWIVIILILSYLFLIHLITVHNVLRCTLIISNCRILLNVILIALGLRLRLFNLYLFFICGVLLLFLNLLIFILNLTILIVICLSSLGPRTLRLPRRAITHHALLMPQPLLILCFIHFNFI